MPEPEARAEQRKDPDAVELEARMRTALGKLDALLAGAVAAGGPPVTRSAHMPGGDVRDVITRAGDWLLELAHEQLRDAGGAAFQADIALPTASPVHEQGAAALPYLILAWCLLDSMHSENRPEWAWAPGLLADAHEAILAAREAVEGDREETPDPHHPHPEPETIHA